ncbi:MAG: alpha/beta hydrolase [Phycisphaerae bacterium]|nr:alpha/beta hydrolase [Phycisphaerae bacterium]
MRVRARLGDRSAGLLFCAAVMMVCLFGAASSLAAERSEPSPPVPKGFGSTQEVKEAIGQGKVRLVNLFIPLPGSIEVRTNIEYGRVGERLLQLDLYQPKGLGKPVPAVILIHGGGWKSGDRKIYRYYCIKLAEKGYVTATMSYRLSKEAPYPAAVQDAKCAVRWLRANARKHHVDPDKIAVLGGSAGGHLAMMVGYSWGVKALEGNGGNAGASSAVQAVINFYGPVDLTADEAKRAGAVIDFMGGRKYDEAEAQYREASPIIHLTKKAPPTLILHGTIDDTVPIAQADLLAKRLKELGVPYEYERLEGWPHTMDLAEDVNRRCLWRVEQFLARHLPVPPGALPPTTRPVAE